MTEKLKNGLLIGLLSASVVCSGTAIGVSVATIEPEKGDQGVQGVQGAQGIQGVGINDVTVSYTYDNDGVETKVTTYGLTSGNPIVTTEKTGRTVVALTGNQKVNGIYSYDSYMPSIIQAGETPVIEIEVALDDNTTKYVTVTDDMYINPVDYTKATPIDMTMLNYPIAYLNVAGYFAEVPYLVEDGVTPILSACSAYNNVSPVILKSDIGNANATIAGVMWGKAYSFDAIFGMSANEDTFEISTIKGDQLSIENYTTAGFYELTVTNGTETYPLPAYVCDTFDPATQLDLTNTDDNSIVSFIMNGSYYSEYVEQGETLTVADNTWFAAKTLEGAYYFNPVTAADFTVDGEAFDSSVGGYKYATVKYTVGTTDVVSESAYIFVYDTVETKATLDLSYGYTLETVADGIPEWTLSYNKYNEYDDEETSSTMENLVYEEVELTADMITNDVDFTTAGVKLINLAYDGQEFTIAVELQAAPTGLVTDFIVYQGRGEISWDLTLTQNESIADAINNKFVNQQAYVTYSAKVNGIVSFDYDPDTYEEIPVYGVANEVYVYLEGSMFDYSNVDVTKAGTYTATLTYYDYVQEITVTVVPDLTNETPTATLANDYSFFVGATMWDRDPVNVKLYANGYAELELVNAGSTAVVAYTLTDNLLTFIYDGVEYTATISDSDTDGTLDTISAYTVDYSTLDVVATYEVDSYILKLYENDMLGYVYAAEADNPEAYWNYYSYTLVDNVLTYNNGMYDVSYYVDGTNLIEIYKY